MQIRKTKEKKSASSGLGPVLALGQKNIESALSVVNEWNSIENITQLVQRFPSIRLFEAPYEGQVSVLRCDVCYKYLTKNPYFDRYDQNDVVNTTNKGVGW